MDRVAIVPFSEMFENCVIKSNRAKRRKKKNKKLKLEKLIELKLVVNAYCKIIKGRSEKLYYSLRVEPLMKSNFKSCW